MGEFSRPARRWLLVLAVLIAAGALALGALLGWVTR